MILHVKPDRKARTLNTRRDDEHLLSVAYLAFLSQPRGQWFKMMRNDEYRAASLRTMRKDFPNQAIWLSTETSTGK